MQCTVRFRDLKKVKIVRNAYAIEYDCINALQLKPTFEFKKISDLFAGGQFNGSSGYEEAAVQGFMAGVNAVMKNVDRRLWFWIVHRRI